MFVYYWVPAACSVEITIGLCRCIRFLPFKSRKLLTGARFRTRNLNPPTRNLEPETLGFLSVKKEQEATQTAQYRTIKK